MLMLVPAVPMLLIGLLFYAVAPAWSHPFIVGIVAAVATAAVVAGVRRIIRYEGEVTANSRPLDNYRWRAQWDAAQFLRQFELFLRVRGWRIIDAATLQPDRILVVADKTKTRNRIALLGIRPGHAAAAADLDALEAARTSKLATRAALIVDAKPTEDEVHTALSRGIMTLRFADMDGMEEALNVVD